MMTASFTHPGTIYSLLEVFLYSEQTNLVLLSFK